MTDLAEMGADGPRQGLLGQKKMQDDGKHRFFQVNIWHALTSLGSKLRNKEILSTDVVILLFIACTQGFRSGTSAISTEELSELTGYTKVTIRHSIKRLKKEKLLAIVPFGKHESWQASPFIFLVGGSKVRGMARMRHLAYTGEDLSEKQRESVDRTRKSIRRFLGESDGEDFGE